MTERYSCALCSCEIDVPKGTVVPEDCDVVCVDCGETVTRFQEERERQGKSLH